MIFTDSLKNNRDFVNVYTSGRSYANKYLVIYTLKNNSDRNRLGISVSKKVGNSVVRHRLKRLIKESKEKQKELEAKEAELKKLTDYTKKCLIAV